LTLAYRDVNDRAAYAAQRESLSRLVEKLESHAPQHSEGIGKWALPYAIQLTKQQLARLDATADTNN
jgi:hypothetical protein